MNKLSGQDAVGVTLVIGAGSSIAQALVRQCLAQDNKVITISRQPPPVAGSSRHLGCDYSAASIAEACAALADVGGQLSQVFICHGLLHGQGVQPEKRLEDIDAEAMARVLQANTIVPALWLRHLLPLLRGNRRCLLVAFSARVGSISDNQKGGWYSYRASKAALNMVMKTASIEYARRAPAVKLGVFHPGTVDTPLSSPFQHFVPAQQLFQPDEVATRLLQLAAGLPHDGQLSYIDWAGKTIAW